MWVYQCTCAPNEVESHLLEKFMVHHEKMRYTEIDRAEVRGRVTWDVK